MVIVLTNLVQSVPIWSSLVQFGKIWPDLAQSGTIWSKKGTKSVLEYGEEKIPKMTTNKGRKSVLENAEEKGYTKVKLKSPRSGNSVGSKTDRNIQILFFNEIF